MGRMKKVAAAWSEDKERKLIKVEGGGSKAVSPKQELFARRRLQDFKLDQFHLQEWD